MAKEKPRKSKAKTVSTKQRSMIRAMAPDRYVYVLDRLGLSQRGAARFLGIAERTSRAMVKGDAAIDPSKAMLLEIMLAYKIAPEVALRLIGIDVKAAARATIEQRGAQALPRYYEDLKKE